MKSSAPKTERPFKTPSPHGHPSGWGPSPGRVSSGDRGGVLPPELLLHAGGLGAPRQAGEAVKADGETDRRVAPEKFGGASC